MRTAAILPVKRLGLAKQRLRASVAEELRAGLAQAMVADVLSALSDCSSIERTIVVTSEPAVAADAGSQGALVVPDADEDGQSAAVTRGISRALREGFERVLCIPGDCPTLDPGELDELLGGRGAARVDRTAPPPPLVVIVPDRHGTGTNGLLLSPPDAIAPSFGPDSCARHRALAEAAGARWRLERPASLLLDIDTGEDLRVLRGRLQSSRPRGRRTGAALGQRDTPAVETVSA